MSEEDFLAGPNVDIKGSGNLAQKSIEDKNTAQQSQQAAYKNVEGLKSATSLETKEISVKVKENKNKSIENFVQRDKKITYTENLQFLSSAKYGTTTTEGKKVQ